jgi:hypothetical protein
MSQAGYEAIILTIPDAPIDILEVEASRTATSITISWSEGPSNGGASVIDYRVSFDQSTDTYVVLSSEVLTRQYTATGLTSGLYYKFKIEARNTYGYSLESSEVSIICATVPSIPAAPVTSNNLDQV